MQVRSRLPNSRVVAASPTTVAYATTQNDRHDHQTMSATTGASTQNRLSPCSDLCIDDSRRRGHEKQSVPGALKHAFDVCYYPCLDATRGRPFGVYLHGNEGTEGAERGIDSITTGLGWIKAADTVVVSGKPSKGDLEACWNLGATIAPS